MYTSGYNIPSGYFIIMGADKLLGLRCHGVFYTGFICQGRKKASGQGNCRYLHSKIMEEENDIIQIIVKTHSVF